MDKILSLSNSTPSTVAVRLAERVKARRLELDLTQEGLARRAGLPTATYRRFERTGEISLAGLLRVAMALDSLDDFERLFSDRKYRTLDDVVNATALRRKRGRRNG